MDGMDPVALATVTSAVTLLATEAGKGLAGEAAKDLWTQIRTRLGLAKEPPRDELAPAVAGALAQDEGAAGDVVRLLQQHAGHAGDAAALVGRIDAEKVVYIANQTVFGGQTFNL
jgi:hypothetical protein